ncbi:MAG: M18 family aminopeptidase [Planctomycetota bacterium]
MSDVTPDLLDFIAAGPTPFHVVAEVARRLDAAGFEPLDETARWELRPGGRYRVVRGETTIAAFVLGQAPPSEAGFALVGAHTDSPNLRLKPRAAFEREGYRQVGVETYGGVLLQTWFDRDLGLSGRLLVASGDAAPRSVLVRCDDPVARIPRLAIHLDATANDAGIADRQIDLAPILGLTGEGPDFETWLRRRAGLADGETVLATDLMLHPVEPPAIGGIDGDLVFAPRLDNLASCHAAVRALLDHVDAPSAATRGLLLYDHEEVGSTTRQGAAGSLLADLVARLGGEKEEDRARARARSWFLSVDMAHARHPNRPEKHDPQHKPALNGGPVIKYNANARYATDGETAAHFKRLCAAADVPVQEFVMRTGSPCGSTIGPVVAAQLGLRTADVGCPMLSMHSARETAGARDQDLMIRALGVFFS